MAQFDRYRDLMADLAFLQAVEAAGSALDMLNEFTNPDPVERHRLVAMMVLVAFANAGGLTEPHAGNLGRFAPDLGGGGAQTEH